MGVYILLSADGSLSFGLWLDHKECSYNINHILIANSSYYLEKMCYKMIFDSFYYKDY